MRPVGILGAVILVAGIIGMLLAASMDTSVAVRDVNLPSAVRAYVPSDMRVNNLGLMQEKQNYLIGAGVVAIIGAILLAADWVRSQSAPVTDWPKAAKDDSPTESYDA
jgi:hypothetical protein